jgi:hypothetical protein
MAIIIEKYYFIIKSSIDTKCEFLHIENNQKQK